MEPLTFISLYGGKPKEMELTEIDFAKCEQALYSDLIDLGYEMLTPPKFHFVLSGNGRIDAPDWVRERMTRTEYEDYRSEYAVSIGDEIRFDNLAIGSKYKPLDLSNPHGLTLGKIYRVVEIDTGNRFGRYSKVYIYDDTGKLTFHIRGRFTKMNISSIEEPLDDDLI